MRSLQEIKEYCSWNNIPFTTIQIKDENEFPEGEKIMIDTNNCIGGTLEALTKFIKGE
jgi:hypothetical protein